MELNNSCQSSTNSADTDVLIKIPNNFFDPNLQLEKSHFSNDNDFLRNLDNFLQAGNRDETHNSTTNEVLSYKSFSEQLQQSEIEKPDEDLNLQEERLKRRHFEALCHILQKKILQYQQKSIQLTKLVEEKDQIVRRLKNNEGLDVENSRLGLKIQNLEREISDTIQLINKFQAKNEVLELKIENLTSTSSEMREISKRQIQDLEVRLSNTVKIECDLKKEIEDLKMTCKAEKDNFVKEKHTRSVLDRETSSLKSQLKQIRDDRVRILENHEKEKQNLEQKQKKIFGNMMSDFADKERKLLKELDMQRAALKNYYQAQLESALEQKVAEFQEQLENFQEDIRCEAEKRDRSLNERTIQQVEMILRKNEEEIDLMSRKCAEEVDLYKIQLLNASRTIESLESKLSEYQVRRRDIAENLHSIMETQWKKTLEILTHPSSLQNTEELESNEVSESDNNRQGHAMNNLSKSEENLKSELLRNYIDKLLKQSPKSDKVNDESNSHQQRGSKSRPWK